MYQLDNLQMNTFTNEHICNEINVTPYTKGDDTYQPVSINSTLIIL